MAGKKRPPGGDDVRWIATVEIPVMAETEEEAGDLVMDALDEMVWDGEPFSVAIRQED